MTPALLDRPFAAGATLYQPARRSPAVRAARDFYERGAPEVDRSIKIEVVDGSGAWLASFMQDRINDLLRLPSGWDGGRARQVSLHSALGAVNAAFSLCVDTALAPQIFPLVDGGLQLEWHAAGQSLEIEIDADGDGHVLAIAADGTELVNEDFAPDSPHLLETRAILREIGSRVARAR